MDPSFRIYEIDHWDNQDSTFTGKNEKFRRTVVLLDQNYDQKVCVKYWIIIHLLPMLKFQNLRI